MKRYSKADKAWLVEEWKQSGASKWAFTKGFGNWELHSRVGASGFLSFFGK